MLRKLPGFAGLGLRVLGFFRLRALSKHSRASVYMTIKRLSGLCKRGYDGIGVETTRTPQSPKPSTF